ncbi:efflux transporter outer membrane subunit [bacterium]|nr:efflux transporter outer membrane subunit [bacterium]
MLKNYHMKLILIFLSALITMGCFAVGPDYVKPSYDMPNKWNTSLNTESKEVTKDKQALIDWWKSFDDPVLTDLISRAISGNFDLKNAIARIRETRASWGVSKADLIPTANTSASFTSSKSYDDNANDARSKSYSIGIDASWEIDLFGGLRRAAEASEATYEAMKENFNDVLVSLVSEVALNYIEVRTYQTLLALAEDNLRIQSESYDLAKLKFSSGLSNELDLKRAKNNMEYTRANLSNIKQNIDVALNHIAVLLGANPGSLHEVLSTVMPIPKASINIDVGLPVDILRRRPDVRIAERNLAAQTARIGVAKADLYPKFSLTGSFGIESIAIDDLFSKDSMKDSFGPRITWKILNFQSIRKNIEVQNAKQEQTLIQYEAAILDALEEVENAFTAYVQEQIRRQSAVESYNNAKEIYDLTLLQFNSGLLEYQDVLDSQIALFSYQTQLGQSDGNLVLCVIKIYKALGGGWES